MVGVRLNLELGDGILRVHAGVGGVPPLVARIETGAPIEFDELIRNLLGAEYLHVPSDFPRVVFVYLSAGFESPRSISLEARSTASWSRPWGILEGLSFERLDFSLRSGATEDTEIAFSAAVEFGDLVSLEGWLLFRGGTLVVAATRLLQPLPVARFLGWCVPGIDWEELLPITFRPATEGGIRIYYAAEAYRDYSAGFTVDDLVVDIFDFTATLSIHVQDGVSLAGSTGRTLDFGFLRIGGPSGGTMGPEIRIRSSRATKQFGVSGSVTFLGAEFGTIDARVERSLTGPGWQLAARISHPGDIGPFKKPAFAFRWSPGHGFRVDEWPMPDVAGGPLVDFVEALNKLPRGTCEPFVRSMFRDLIETRFDFTASMGSSPNSSGGGSPLGLVLRGSYTIRLRGGGDILTLPLPADIEITLATPEQFSFDSLGEALLAALQQAAVGLAKQVVDDPGRSVAFFTAVAAPAVLPQIISMLVCRGWGAPLPPPPPPPPPIPPPVIPPVPPFPPVPVPGRPGPTVVTEVSYDRNRGALAATWRASDRAEGYTTVLRTADAIVRIDEWPGLSGALPFDESNPAGFYAVNVQAWNGAGRGDWSPLVEIYRLAPVRGLSLLQEGQALRLTWTPGVDPPAVYEYLVVSPLGSVFASDSVPGATTDARVPLPSGSPAGTYRAVVRAVPSTASVVLSQWSEEAVADADPARAPGWLVSLDNDLGSRPTDVASVVVQRPPVAGVVVVRGGSTEPLSAIRVQQFLVWHGVAGTEPWERVVGSQVQTGTSGDRITLRYTDIERSNLPQGFSSVGRRGLRPDADAIPLWAEELTSVEMAEAVSPDVVVQQLAWLLLFPYPTLTQNDLCAALVAVRPHVLSVAGALVGVAEHYAGTPTPVSPASVAVALTSAWAATGQPLAPQDVAPPLREAFGDVGQPLDAPATAAALCAAFPPAQTRAGVLPIVAALSGTGFGIREGAGAFRQVLPTLPVAALAGALKDVYVGPPLEAGAYAEKLHALGMSAQGASPLITAGYAWLSADALAQVLVEAFPETTGSALLLGWCLQLSGFELLGVAGALNALISGLRARDLAAALKVVFPTSTLGRAITQLQTSGVSAATAAVELTSEFSDVNVTQLGWILLTFFRATAPGPAGMTVGLATARWPMGAAAQTLVRLFPRLTATQIAVILKAAYQGGQGHVRR